MELFLTREVPASLHHDKSRNPHQPRVDGRMPRSERFVQENGLTLLQLHAGVSGLFESDTLIFRSRFFLPIIRSLSHLRSMFSMPSSK